MSDKAYEDVSDEDIRALAEEHRKYREGNRAQLAMGTYRTRVKSQKPLAEVPERGIFAGQVQVLLTHAVLDKNGDEVLGAVIFNRMALPLAAPDKVIGGQGKGMAFSNVLKLLGLQDAEDGDQAAKDAVAKAKAAARGEEVFVGAECFIRLSAGKPYVKDGVTKQGTDIRLAQFLKKGEELADLPGSTDASDMFDFACCDE